MTCSTYNTTHVFAIVDFLILLETVYSLEHIKYYYITNQNKCI